jgi:hypothetical protein
MIHDKACQENEPDPQERSCAELGQDEGSAMKSAKYEAGGCNSHCSAIG